MTTSDYAKIASIDVSKHVEKKNGLSYLSWAWAVDQLFRLDPDAEWHYPAPINYGNTMMVHCTVKAFGKHRTAHLPVMNHKNQPIPNPDAFQVNTAMQRCLVKAIALHGLGLYIYAGEDLPLTETGEEQPKEKKAGDGIKGPIPANVEGQELLAKASPEHQQWARDEAIDIMAHAQDGKNLADRWDNAHYSDEEKLMLSILLPADVRRKIKDQQRAKMNAKARSPELATQP